MNTLLQLFIIPSLLVLTDNSSTQPAKVDHLRIRVISSGMAYEGAYLFATSASEIKTVQSTSDLDAGTLTDFVHAMFVSKGKENVTVELYQTQNGNETMSVSGTGKIVVLSTVYNHPGINTYRVQTH